MSFHFESCLLKCIGEDGIRRSWITGTTSITTKTPWYYSMSAPVLALFSAGQQNYTTMLLVFFTRYVIDSYIHKFSCVPYTTRRYCPYQRLDPSKFSRRPKIDTTMNDKSVTLQFASQLARTSQSRSSKDQDWSISLVSHHGVCRSSSISSVERYFGNSSKYQRIP